MGGAGALRRLRAILPRARPSSNSCSPQGRSGGKLTDHRIFRLFTDDQIRKNDIDTLKRWLRPKLGGYTVAIRDLRSDNEFFRGVVWPERPSFVADLSYPPVKYAKLNRASR